MRIIFFCFLLCSGTLYAQTAKLGLPPLIQGCEEQRDTSEAGRLCISRKVAQHIAQNFRYPEEARTRRVQGRVFVNFIVERDGGVKNITMHKSLERRYFIRFWKRKYARLIDEEAMRVISLLQFEKPGLDIHGQSIRTEYTIPINAKLE